MAQMLESENVKMTAMLHGGRDSEMSASQTDHVARPRLLDQIEGEMPIKRKFQLNQRSSNGEMLEQAAQS